ncbi:deoxynucleoside triphosphate triphosphohydrolase SAMHD1-like [Labrus mixtus]|uniref:deoxynucleoside triphosphate triphosphohydrolase SAMHD1-like n=1 Tax=Labrus mixtus TaxID=508554 RepID=UPI0029C09E6A|nr:deoxynucleoside triphosphate triphosphohydrolase SAMHD1-like [Labrus mixtus]
MVGFLVCRGKMASPSKKAKKPITKVFNDPIHGSIELHPLLIKIIDTPQFQRLRFIKQLGGVYFVYPGASHNRFEHSIGVGYLAGKLAEDLRSRQPELEISDEDVLCVQIAGLCHDLGHGPFSHLYDGMFLPKALEKKEEMRRNGELGEEEKLEEWKHEKGSCDMLDHLVRQNDLKPEMEKYGLIPEDDITFIKEMIAGPLQESKEQEDEKGYCDIINTLVELIDLEKVMMEKYEVDPEDVKNIKEMIAGQKSKSKKEQSKLEQEMKEKYELNPEDVKFIQEKIAEDKKWPYKGRKEEKSFLYEIVSNKKNGVDVDKFDYLARDSSYLGIKNNFDFHRFLQFARVCKVDGRKTICTRDKEEDNMYDLFYTRHRLHKRACQHRVSQILQEMIAEAFVKADGHIEIEGSEGSAGSEGTIGSKGSRGLFTLSTAFKNMETYTKLTDNVFEEILNSSRPELQEAKKILQDIVSRKIYKFVGERKPKDPIEDWKSQKYGWKIGLARPLPNGESKLKLDDFEILVINMDYGMKDKNPVEHMHFYSKKEPDVAKPMSTENASRIRTTIFSEQLIKVFCKKIDEQSVEAAKKHFEQWLEMEPNLDGSEEAREILQDIASGKRHKFVGETKPKETIKNWKSRITGWKKGLAPPNGKSNLTPEDFEILVINMDYGMKDKNPVEHMHFYSKYEPDVAKPMSIENASRIGTTIYSEQLIRVFCKKIDDEKSVEAARQHFEQWKFKM